LGRRGVFFSDLGEFSCFLELPVEAENVLETNQPTTNYRPLPKIKSHKFQDASLAWAAWWAAPRLGGAAGARWRWAVAGGAAGAAAAAECVWALWTVQRRRRRAAAAEAAGGGYAPLPSGGEGESSEEEGRCASP
jgi:hypothetical protein